MGPNGSSAPDLESVLAEAVDLARSLGIEVDEPIILANVYSLRIHLAPSPVVARVPTLTGSVRSPVAPWLAREIELTRFLAKAGAPIVPPCDDINPGPHPIRGGAISFWKYVRTVPNVEPTQQEFGRMLGELHTVLRTYPDELPLLTAASNDIPATLEIIASKALLQADDIALLWAVYERLKPALTKPSGPLQVLHGDAHPGNLIATDQGLLWNDFEDVCTGPVASDLASMLVGEEALAAYPNPPAAEVRALYRDVRRLQVVSWIVALPFEFDSRASTIVNLLEYFRTWVRGAR